MIARAKRERSAKPHRRSRDDVGRLDMAWGFLGQGSVMSLLPQLFSTLLTKSSQRHLLCTEIANAGREG